MSMFWITKTFCASICTLCFLSIQSKDCPLPKALGVSDGRIKDWQFSASSHARNFEPRYARLNESIGGGAWCNRILDFSPWIRINLSDTFRITQVAIQGGLRGQYMIRSYQIFYDWNGLERPIFKTFDGPKHEDDISRARVNVITSVITLKVSSRGFFGCLRLELYGCLYQRNICAKRNPCEYKCTNRPTGPVCVCPPGFTVAQNGRNCTDIDECSRGYDNCDVNTTNCVNTPGWYKCDCKHPGLRRQKFYRYRCFDRDECREKTDGCQHKCENQFQGYKCSCNHGYKLSGDNRTCEDIDECSNGRNDCDLTTTLCTNKPGSYKCKCLSGFQPNTSYNCTDIDECKIKNGGCNGSCTNIHGSYKCSCPIGLKLHTNDHTCVDMNECENGNHDCQQICNNQPGSYSCDCDEGFQLNADRISCKDINECFENNGRGPCQHSCRNNIGSYDCLCPPGFNLSPDEHSCLDVNECLTRNYTCNNVTSTCINTLGSFQCQCKKGYIPSNQTHQCVGTICSALQNAKDGYIIPSDCTQKNQKHYKDVCTFKCNPGFEPNQKSVRTAYCNSDGNWDLRGGYQAICQRIRCDKVKEVTNGSLVPSTCRTLGAEYGEKCNMYCDNGFHLTGINQITCQQNGSYDGNFDKTKCLPKNRLNCPKDVTLVLPLGANETSLPISKLSVHLDPTRYKTVPDGVLTGKHKFQAEHQSQPVQVVSIRESFESCIFLVNAIDNEPPTVMNCPTKDIYVTVLGTRGLVSWPEPKFEDNVGVEKLIQNIRNNDVLPQQVYFVYYAARDNYGNENVCRFFVHVKAQYCSRENIPGGDGGKAMFFPSASNGISAYITCGNGKTLSANVTSAPIFHCTRGIWQHVPDCVDFIPKNGTCPAGYTTVIDRDIPIGKCAKCPKGTMGKSNSMETCYECPVGHYQDEEGALSCKKCPAGTTTLKAGSRSLKQCQALCQPGGYSLTGANPDAGCTECPDGSYQDLHGQRSCKLCPNGGYSFKGAKSESNCTLPARVSKILPESLVVSKVVGGTIVIKCYGIGNPAPFMQIKNVTQLAPDSLRGKSMLQPLVTGNKYMSGLQLTITNAQTYDSAVYKCSADNIKGNIRNFDEREIIVEVSAE